MQGQMNVCLLERQLVLVSNDHKQKAGSLGVQALGHCESMTCQGSTSLILQPGINCML